MTEMISEIPREAVNLAQQILDGKLEDLPDMGEARITWIACPKKIFRVMF